MQSHPQTITPLSRRALLTGMGTLALAGCASMPSAPQTATAPLTLVEAFRGRTRGTGVFRVPLVGVERRFTALLNGRATANSLIVVEDFFFEDGEKDRLTWRFTRTSPTTWTGRREDTVGEATVRELGTEIRLDYVADVKSRGKVTRLGFSDVIYRASPNLIVNEAVVSSLGVPIGSVRFELRR